MIHIITGNTGAGKSTYANRLVEETGAIVFSIDDWNNTLFLKDKNPSDGIDWMLERIERAETMIWSLCMQLDMQSQEVVLDLGFSKFEHRDKFRKLAKDHAIDIKLHFLDYDYEVRKSRILNRNKTKGDTYVFDVDEEMFEFMETWFERPSVEELKGAIVLDMKSELERDMIPEVAHYLAEFSKHHHTELLFCMRLSTGLDDRVKLDVLRSFVLDFWEQVLSKHLSLEERLFTDLNQSDNEFLQFSEENAEIKAMINGIRSSESVSNNYLTKFLELLRLHIRFEERSFYPYVLESYDDGSLNKIKDALDDFEASPHEFKPQFWED